MSQKTKKILLLIFGFLLLVIIIIFINNNLKRQENRRAVEDLRQGNQRTIQPEEVSQEEPVREPITEESRMTISANISYSITQLLSLEGYTLESLVLERQDVIDENSVLLEYDYLGEKISVDVDFSYNTSTSELTINDYRVTRESEPVGAVNNQELSVQEIVVE